MKMADEIECGLDPYDPEAEGDLNMYRAEMEERLEFEKRKTMK